MTNDEAKRALFERLPVVHDGITYSYIKEIVYWVNNNGELCISAVLLDRNNRTTVRPQIKDVKLL